MKNKMEDLIKNIILNKSYFELSSSEQKSIQEWASNEEEFDALKAVLMATQSMADQSKVKPSSSVKQRLDDRFAAKHAGQNVTLWSKFLPFFLSKKHTVFQKACLSIGNGSTDCHTFNSLLVARKNCAICHECRAKKTRGGESSKSTY